MPLLPAQANVRPVRRAIFQEYHGVSFNSTNTKFYGVRYDNFMGLFLAGQSNNSYAAHFAMITQTNLAYFEKNGYKIPIQSTQVIFLSFPKLLFQIRNPQGKTFRQHLMFSNLDWNIDVQKRRIGTIAQLSVNLSASLDVVPALKNSSIVLNFQINASQIETTKKIPVIRQENINSYSISEKKSFGRNIGLSLKINHYLFNMPKERINLIILPVLLRIFMRVDFPKDFLEARSQIQTVQKYENIGNTSIRPSKISLRHGSLLNINYSWVPNVKVDGMDKVVNVKKQKSNYSTRLAKLNQTYYRLKKDASLGYGLIYPSGRMIIHDPDFSASLFQEYQKIVSLSPQIQWYGQLVALPFITALLVIMQKKKKYP